MGNAASIGREIRADISKTLRDVCLLAADNLANATPVDTGHASTNWILSTGSPYNGIAGSRESVSVAEQEQGIADLQDYDVVRDGPIYLRNNVLYLKYLDAGWSQQADAGFVGASFQAAARRAPRGRKTAVRKMLRSMSREAYRKAL